MHNDHIVYVDCWRSGGEKTAFAFLPWARPLAIAGLKIVPITQAMQFLMNYKMSKGSVSCSPCCNVPHKSDISSTYLPGAWDLRAEFVPQHDERKEAPNKTEEQQGKEIPESCAKGKCWPKLCTRGSGRIFLPKGLRVGTHHMT